MQIIKHHKFNITQTFLIGFVLCCSILTVVSMMIGILSLKTQQGVIPLVDPQIISNDVIVSVTKNDTDIVYFNTKTETIEGYSPFFSKTTIEKFLLKDKELKSFILSPDKTKLAYVNTEDTLSLIDVANKSEVKITTKPENVLWSKNSQLLFYVKTVLNQSNLEQNFYTFDTLTKKTRIIKTLVSPIEDQSQYSVYGQQGDDIIYTEDTSDLGYSFKKISISSGKETEFEPQLNVSFLNLSPNAEQIIYSPFQEGTEKPDKMIWFEPNTNRENIVQLSLIDTDFTWTDDGQSIILIRYGDNSKTMAEIEQISLDTGKKKMLGYLDKNKYISNGIFFINNEIVFVNLRNGKLYKISI